MTRKAYLGDGVYASVDERANALVLTTENGIRETNRIVLELDVLGNLMTYVESLDVKEATSDDDQST